VAQIDQLAALHHLAEPREIERPKLLPLGDDDERARTFRAGVGVAAEGDVASRISSVFGLKASPSTATVLPRNSPPSAAETLRAMARFRASLTATTASTTRNAESLS